MVKIGNLKLTKKQKKRTFHLPIQQVVIVPSTSGIKDQKKITQIQLSKRVNNVRRFLSNRFGGFTSVRATGGFVLRNGKLVKERVIKVTSFATKKDFKKHRPEVLQQIGRWGKKWKQESVGYEHEGDLFIIEPPKKGPVKSMKKVIITPTIKRRVMLSNLAKARRIKAKRR